MKKTTLLSTLLMAAVLGLGMNAALAAGDIDVKIDSFSAIDLQHHLGEVCGTVTVNSPALPKIGNYVAVTVTADPKTGNPGEYTVLASPLGHFCTTLVTYTGTASATAWFPSASLSATSEIAEIRKQR